MITFKGIDPSFTTKPFITFQGFKGMDYCQPYDLEKENTGQGHAYIGFVPDRFVFSTFPKGWISSLNYAGTIRAAGEDTYRMDDRYLVADSQPTIVTKGNNREPIFEGGLKDRFNAEALERDSIQLLPNHIAYMNSYSWHKAPRLEAWKQRTFMLMAFRRPVI